MARIVQDLTERQRSVMERIDRRVPIKVIAQELGISETRINQHIRALKDIYQAESLGALVEIYRQTEHPSVQDIGRDLHQIFAIDAALLDDAKALSQGSVMQSSVEDYEPDLEVENLWAMEPKVIDGFLDQGSAIGTRCGVIASVFSLVLTSILLAASASRLIEAAIG